jgi:hypothetical protein
MNPEINNLEIEEPKTYRLIDLFISPRKFFRQSIDDDDKSSLLYVALLMGIASVPDGVSDIIIGEWTSFWFISIIGGFISAIFIWHLGGWWYRMRLRFSGAVKPDKRKARYVYIYSSFVYAAPAVLIYLILTASFKSYAEAIEEGIVFYLPMIGFLFYSIFTSYFGAREVFNVSKWKGRLWFIILPGFFYCMIFIVSAFASEVYHSEKDYQLTAADGSYVVQLHGDWKITSNIGSSAELEHLYYDAAIIISTEDKDASIADYKNHFKETLVAYGINLNPASFSIEKDGITDHNSMNIKIDVIDDDQEYRHLVYLIEGSKKIFEFWVTTLKEDEEYILPEVNELLANLVEI